MNLSIAHSLLFYSPITAKINNTVAGLDAKR